VLSPDLDPQVLRDTALAAAQTLQIAVAGLLLSALVAFPLALLLAGSSSAARPLRAAARLLAAVLRGVPELVYALVFVAVVGLGPLAGTLAVAVHGAGLLAKLWSEQLEAVDRRPVEAVRLSGAGRAAVLVLATLPLARPGLLSLLLYQLECNVRTATVLGIVGAGGLGQAIDLSLRLFDHGRLGTLVLTVLVLVLGVDALSRRLRAAVGADARPVSG
jgi:phosphonate transport system permease protein